MATVAAGESNIFIEEPEVTSKKPGDKKEVQGLAMRKKPPGQQMPRNANADDDRPDWRRAFSVTGQISASDSQANRTERRAWDGGEEIELEGGEESKSGGVGREGEEREQLLRRWLVWNYR